MIFHITTRADWAAAQSAGRYEATSLRTEGFIHCSTREQVVAIANTRFRGRNDLLLLGIDEERLDATLRYEEVEESETPFPHVYGPLNLEAVTCVYDFPPMADGTFAWPQPS